MRKGLFYGMLGLMGIMGTLSMGVVNASATITTIEPPTQGSTRFGIQFDDGNGHVIKILNRNLGTNVVGTGEESYGRFFQWGNNYGFSVQDGTGSIPLYEVSESEINMGANLIQWYDSYNAYGYYGQTFIKSIWDLYGGDYWKDGNAYSSNHENLWGGGRDYENGRGQESYNPVSGRKGPCPEGTHIPSQAEWDNLIKYYVAAYDDHNMVVDVHSDYGQFIGAYNNLAVDFANDFKLPYGGYIDADKKTTSEGIEYRDAGVLGYYWSSSPNSRVDPTSRVFTLGVNMLWNQRDSMRTQGFNIRCFYDDSVEEYEGSLTITFDSKGGNYEPDSQTVSYNSLGSEPTDPTKDGYTFGGWYEKGVTEPFDFSTPITRNIKLYARRNIITNASVSSISAPWAYNSYNGTRIDGIEFDDGNGYSVKILNRDLGATTAGTGSNSYGYHYQWGNNYGFDGGCSCPNYNGNNICLVGGTMKVSPACYDYSSMAQRYDPYSYDHKGITSSYFIKSSWDPYRLDYWNDSSTVNHEKLRGGEGDYDNDWGLTSSNDVTWRQGPCPRGYHVPSQGEWNELFTHWWMAYSGKYEDYQGIKYTGTDYGAHVYYDVNNNKIIQDFQNDFNITFGGYRDGEDGAVKGKGEIGYYWTSSPNTASEALSRKFAITPTGIYSDSDSTRAQGYSVRCFYDPNPAKYYANFYDNSWNNIGYMAFVEGEEPEGEIPAAPTIDGYTFYGWNVNGQIYYTLTTGIIENAIKYPMAGMQSYYYPQDVTITAEYTPNTYYITYNLNGGELAPGVTNPGTYNINSYIVLNNPTRVGYNFIGWSGTNIAGTSQSVTISYSTGNRNYEANWEAIEYTLTVDLGDGRTQTITGYYGDPITVPQDPTRDGYSFAGWNPNFPTTMPAESQTITAQWDAVSYNIGYELNGGELSGTDTNPTSYSIITDAITLNNPIKTGHNFLGWSGTDIAGTTQSVTIPSGSMGNRNYEANWEAIEYTLTVDLGDGRTQTITGYYGDPITVPQDPTRDGYSFAGWNPSFPTTMPAESQTITAQWTAIEYTLTVDLGDGRTQIITGYYGDPITVPQDPTRDGYTFAGWNPSFPTTMPAQDMQIEALWDRNSGGNSGGGSSGGGGLRKDNCPNGDYSNSYYDGICEAPKNEEDDNGKGIDVYDDNISDDTGEGGEYSDELVDAYHFAYNKGITTLDTIQKADMGGYLTRIAMAKMLSQYAINVLGMKPDETRNNKFRDIPDSLDMEYDNGVTLAYQLSIMGINMPNNEFRPFDLVPRAEFVTALSRLLYHTPEGALEGTSEYYLPHMIKLATEKIITNTNPGMLELRGYVMLMLMRSAQ